jgi:hypothetical protein
MEETRSTHNILVGKPKGKRSLGKPRSEWENFEMEIGWKGPDRIHLAQDGDWWRGFVNTVINLRIL